MKTFKCPNCKRDTESKDDIVIILCSCGEYMEEDI